MFHCKMLCLCTVLWSYIILRCFIITWINKKWLLLLSQITSWMQQRQIELLVCLDQLLQRYAVTPTQIRCLLHIYAYCCNTLQQEDLETLAKGCLCANPDKPSAEFRRALETIVKFCPAYYQVMQDKRSVILYAFTFSLPYVYVDGKSCLV